MFALIRLEIKKITSQKKSWMGLLTIVLINLLVALAFVIRETRSGGMTSPADQSRLIHEFINAYTYTQFMLVPTVYMLFPVVLSVFSSYLLAGEFELGSIRMILFRPVSRLQVLLAKFVALSLYSAAMLLCLGVVSYGVSAILFDATGDLLIYGPMLNLPASYKFLIHPSSEAPFRIILSYTLALPMLMGICSMALMFALATRHFTSSSILTSTVYFCSYIVGTVPFLSSIHPLLPTRYWPFWRYALVGTMDSLPWQTIGIHCGWTVAYMVVFLAIGSALFNMKDV